MAQVLLFHHVQGLTPGVTAFADELRAAGHTVHTPDLFGGRTFATIDEGMAFANSPEAGDLEAVGESVANRLPAELVYAGFSFGVMSAQDLAQNRLGARGALLYHSCVSVTAAWSFGSWPEGVPVQVHGMERDPFFADEGDLDAARELVEVVGSGAELFVYPGEQHLFADSSLPSYDAVAAGLLLERTLAFLARVDAG